MTFFILCDNIIIMKEIVNILIDNGYEAYVVGGFVRDYLLGMSTKDIDISTNAPINELKRIFKGKGKSFDKYFAYHIDKDGYSYDITTYRTESKYKKNKPTEVKVAADLGTDLLRRDFTINTFAFDQNGYLVDILGAKKDLNARLIRCVGDTNKKFTEDKTRILRAIRFACTLDFDFHTDIIDFISKKKTYLLNEVPKEFIKSELDKIFDSNGIDKFFFILNRYEISKYFDISFDRVVKSYNRYGIWAQIETDLPFSKKEKTIIDTIKDLLEKKDINFSDMSKYEDDIIFNAASILGLENKVKAYHDVINLHSIIDIDIDMDLFFRYVKFEDMKRVYKIIEKNIMEGYLANNRNAIEDFLRNIRL